jgi:opacity protein-like surface antigen
MQKTIVTALAFLASTVAAVAADLPSKTSAPVTPVKADTTQYYIGVNVSGDVDKARAYSGGAVAGWNVLPFLAVEGTYDISRPELKAGHKFNYEHTVGVNAVPQYKIPATDIVAYGVGGVGYRWNHASTVADHSVYNVGAGLKYEFAKNLEVDGRYTRIDAIVEKYRTGHKPEDRTSVGVNYKF